MTNYWTLQRDATWWIDSDNPDIGGPMGPYSTRKEAEADMRGLQRLDRYGHIPGFVTSDNRRWTRPNWDGKLT